MSRIRFYGGVLAIYALLSSCQIMSKSDHRIVNLNGRWEYRDAEDSIYYEATVPGTVHTDLFKNVLIGDPFYRTNEKSQQWIDKKSWEYKRSFFPDNRLFKDNQVELIFEGLDTYAEVFLNGESILLADNMFRTWRIDISGKLLKGQRNELIVRFESPISYLKKIYDEASFHLPAPNDQAEDKLSVYGRKAPYHFGWDWGPRFVTSGIWKSVYIESWSAVKMDKLHYRQINLNDKSAEIELNAEVTAESDGNFLLTIESYENDQNHGRKGKLLLEKNVWLESGQNILRENFIIEDPLRWWPNGHGDPNLYTLKARLKASNASFQHTSRIGLRTIELVRDSDSVGESFFFRVNNVPIFAKGANYIPQDNFINHVMSTEYDHIIQSAKKANMNMLRVWGGGIYELDYFYDLCDENGIMIWQDFMFACSMYPADSLFIDNVSHEIIDNVSRLRNHPSIALWCGNNEIQDAWHNWGWKIRYTDEQKEIITSNYIKIFHETIPGLLKDLDPDRSYWPSSPAAGPEYGSVSNTKSGDYHYWGVWHGRQPFESYAETIPRFSSEFGFQSFPDLKTIYSYTDPADRQINSEVMLSHQRHPIGNQLILNYMERYYPVPSDFQGFVYMSQVMQAEGVRFGIEATRRSAPFCMGSLYWQLNDCWPVASWSGIDYFGRWKALHYQAAEAYEPEIISFSQSGDSISVFLVSDIKKSTPGVLVIELLTFGGEKLFDYSMQTSFDPYLSKKVLSIKKENITGLVSREKETFLLAEFRSADGIVDRNTFFFERPKDLKLPKIDFDWELKNENKRNKLLVTSKKLARKVFIHYSGEEELRLEPNYFDLMPNETKELIIFKRTRDRIDPGAFKFFCVNQFISLSDQRL